MTQTLWETESDFIRLMARIKQRGIVLQTSYLHRCKVSREFLDGIPYWIARDADCFSPVAKGFVFENVLQDAIIHYSIVRYNETDT